MNRLSGLRALAVGVMFVLLLAYVVFLPRVLPTATLLTAFVTAMGATFLLLGLWSLITARIPGWLPSREVRSELSVRFTGFFCILIAIELAIAESNFLFHWHALWPLDAITAITGVGIALALVVTVRNGRPPQRTL